MSSTTADPVKDGVDPVKEDDVASKPVKDMKDAALAALVFT
jgi:hypothetical protein